MSDFSPGLSGLGGLETRLTACACAYVCEGLLLLFQVLVGLVQHVLGGGEIQFYLCQLLGQVADILQDLLKQRERERSASESLSREGKKD